MMLDYKHGKYEHKYEDSATPKDDKKEQEKPQRVDDTLMWQLPPSEVPTQGSAFRVLVATEGNFTRVDATVIAKIEEIVTVVRNKSTEILL